MSVLSITGVIMRLNGTVWLGFLVVLDAGAADRKGHASQHPIGPDFVLK